MKKELHIKYLNNQCTESELQEFLEWLETDALNEEGKRWGSEAWNSFTETDNIHDNNFIAIFDKIQARIDANNDNSGKLPRLSTLVRWVTKAAAILLIPVLTILFYTLSERKNGSAQYVNFATDSLEVIVPVGSKTVVQLSDGSEVQLNYGSKIKYPHFFSNNLREVTLTGEAYFKVAHNPEKPFIVKTKNLNIKAVGTEFNVLAYPGSDIIETTLVSGKVILEQVKKGGEIKRIGAMNPGSHVNVDLQSGLISTTKGPIEKYISWTEGKLMFDDTPILNVTEKLGMKFNVDFEVKDNIKGYKYTVTFANDPLYQILDLMTVATPISYKILPREKLPDGTYSKQKILLKKR